VSKPWCILIVVRGSGRESIVPAFILECSLLLKAEVGEGRNGDSGQKGTAFVCWHFELGGGAEVVLVQDD
jgi:hypothetical protein